MSGNTFGKIFKITTFGESHGSAMGSILDGCPPQIELTNEDIAKRIFELCMSQQELEETSVVEFQRLLSKKTKQL